MYNTLVLYTFISLIIFFTVLEFYKHKCFLKGIIVEACQSNLGIDNLIGGQFLVKLENGQMVKAEAERCTVCMGQFSIGDEVKLIKSKDKYMVHLPIFWRKCNN